MQGLVSRRSNRGGIAALKDFKGTGMSVIEVSHRSKVKSIMEECESYGKSFCIFPMVIKYCSWAVAQVCSS